MDQETFIKRSVAIYLYSHVNNTQQSKITLKEWYDIVNASFGHEYFYKYLFTKFSKVYPKASIITEIEMTRYFIQQYKLILSLYDKKVNLPQVKNIFTKKDNTYITTNNKFYNSILRSCNKGKQKNKDIKLFFFDDNKWDLNEEMMDDYSSEEEYETECGKEEYEEETINNKDFKTLLIVHRCSSDPKYNTIMSIYNDLDKYVLRNPNDYSYIESDKSQLYKPTLGITGYNHTTIVLPIFKYLTVYKKIS